MQHKSFDIVETKADADAGTFSALVAVFGNVDKGGDRILPGAFKNTLDKWKASGDPIPVILSHSWDDPFHHVGVVTDAVEGEKGLLVSGKLDVEDNDVARQVHRLMLRRSLKEFSFGYSVPKGGERRAKDGANELLEIDLAEVGPTLKGMNPATELYAVKSAVVEQSLQQELREVKARLDTIEKALEDPQKKADVTDKAPKARSVDPLREQAEAVALEFASDGLSLRKPPRNTPPPPPPELVPLDDLKQRMRDEMVRSLSGGITP